MMQATILEVKEDLIQYNSVTAEGIRKECADRGQLLVNVMSSPGSGKTTTLLRTIEALKDRMRIGVLECDIDASVDAETILNAGVKAVQLHTGGMCHMDAKMTKQGLDAIGYEDLDLIFLENVGNLVCPAEYDTGAGLNITILSVPEGDDKPAKYPLMYQVCEAVLINKTDTLPVFDFDMDLVKKRIHALNPKAAIFAVSAKTGEGMKEWTEWLYERTCH